MAYGDLIGRTQRLIRKSSVEYASLSRMNSFFYSSECGLTRNMACSRLVLLCFPNVGFGFVNCLEGGRGLEEECIRPVSDDGS